ncbi:hypothetical protein [Dethiothermospora halolimnae]|uniref:hypothetical protein n=1 Tax=Dethiothermospora halolimnae TaxID=3114390 RepID=UPI003CCBDD4D
MEITNIDKNRDKFKMLLFKMAKSQDILSTPKQKSDVYIELESIYYDLDNPDEFRHFYSDIFAVISQIDKEPQLGNTEILSQNMDIIRRGYKPQNKDENKGILIDVSKQINKLYDHINLDIARLNYFKTIESRTQSDLQKVNGTLNKVETSVKEMEDNIKKADDMEKQYITILGIFAAIVLAFTGGIAFSTSVLENIANASIYRLVFITVALAFILSNTVYILTRFILELNKKEDKVIDYPKFMKNLNIVYIAAIVILIVCWLFDVKKAAELFRNWIY